MDKRQASMLVRSLSASTCKVLFMMFFVGPGTGPAELALMTGLSERTVQRSLEELAYCKLAQRHSRFNGWTLTVQAKQMMFVMQEGPQEPPVLDVPAEVVETRAEKFAGRERKNLRVASSSSSRSLSTSKQKLKTTTTDSGEAQNLQFDTNAEAAVQALTRSGVPEHTRNGKGARDAVSAALEAGWTGEQVLTAIRGWMDYARTPAGSWITHAGFLAAARVASLQSPPQPPPASEQRSREDVAREYIERHYHEIVRS